MSGVPPPIVQPSAYFAARRNATSADPPISIDGRLPFAGGEEEERALARRPAPPPPLPRLVQLGRRLLEHVRRAAAHRPAVGVLRCAAERDIGRPADQHRRALAVRRRRAEVATALPQPR